MPKLKISGKELRAIGFPEGPVISLAMKIAEKQFKHGVKQTVLEQLRAVLQAPENYIAHEIFSPVASQLVPPPEPPGQSVALNQQAIPFDVFGNEHIEEGAMLQMNQAARLPISIAGALMPDAHSGYGLPIGGVLATAHAVIPYGVGVDIGCRMSLSIFDIDPKELLQRQSFFVRELREATLFGSGKEFEGTKDHPVLDNPAFKELALLRGLHSRAWKQLGTSGSGNHFAEFGLVELLETNATLQVPPGIYLGLLSHSGSRALGANVANHYTRIAKEQIRLPGEASNLAWLSLDSEAGMEYWIAMNLAGDYAAACHDVIHDKISVALGRKPIGRVQNHHNFAWKELYQGRELIVHRKGATPAGKDVLGIIPGSMTAPGFIVSGKGEETSIHSAAHGAGRRMSRTKAMASITHNELNDMLQKHGVTLIGGGLDEAPNAYKDIEAVMKSQRSLVNVIGRFIPKIVRMDGTTPPQRKKHRDLLSGE